ncbi:MAG TPA: VOC family protein [Flavobacteriales bacterium]|jgi:catechol 2,3-dioxygenase-like lactoylglutathione lyase family enzyme|nr:VOC family protein [Flavobacteriales bacterium]
MDLNQITLLSTDVARSLAFYQTLGLKLIVDSAPRYVRLACPDGRTTLSIHQADGLVAVGGLTLYFECDALDEQVEALKRSGIAFKTDPTDQPWLWREASLCDPDGHRLILYHAGKNRLDPPWRVQ